MKHFLFILLFLLPCCVWAQQDKQTPQDNPTKVYSFSIEENIAPPATKRVELAMAEAKEISYVLSEAKYIFDRSQIFL
jgi:hypothetical protein